MLIHQLNISIEDPTHNYLIANYGNEAKCWIDKINEITYELSQKWAFTVTGTEPKSRFGCIVYATTERKNVVIKLLPPCCERLRQEIQCYQLLPYHNMVSLYSYDMSLGGILLQRIHCRPITDLEIVANIFQSMFDERTVAADGQLIPYEVAFSASLAFAASELKSRSDNKLNKLLLLIKKALAAYQYIKKNECYYLHGDAHIHNLLFDGSDIFLIDPIGYTGPFEIEYARFIGTYIRENSIYDKSKLYSLVKQICKNNCLISDILYALGLDVTMRACNTFHEGNSYDEIVDAVLWAERTWNVVESLLNHMKCLCKG